MLMSIWGAQTRLSGINLKNENKVIEEVGSLGTDVEEVKRRNVW